MEHEKMMTIVNKHLNKQGKIQNYPSKKTIHPYILAYIAEHFEVGRIYTEKEVNEIIQSLIEFHDYELVRRELFMYHYMDRKRDGSAYWRECEQLS